MSDPFTATVCMTCGGAGEIVVIEADGLFEAVTAECEHCVGTGWEPDELVYE